MINKVLKREKYLLYDSNCLMCEGFLTKLDSIFVNQNLILYIASNPNQIINFNNNIYFDKFLKENLSYLDETLDKTIIYLEKNKIYITYQAILMVLKDSDHKFFKPAAIFLNLLIPRFLGDYIYKLVAKNRRKISWMFFKKKCKFYFKNLIKI